MSQTIDHMNEARILAASKILKQYLTTKDLNLLKIKFAAYKAQKKEFDQSQAVLVELAKGVSTFNLYPTGQANRYLRDVLMDDEQANRSDCNEVGELMSQAWIQTKLEDCSSDR